MTSDQETDRSNCHFAALILARGGDERNIRKLAGVPLLAWVLRAVIDSDEFDSVWVSTENKAIAEVAMEWGAMVYGRSISSARPDITADEGIKEFLVDHPEVDLIAHIQCTSPCLQPFHLQGACSLIKNGSRDSVFSVTRRHLFRWTEVPEDARVNANRVYTVPENIIPAKRPRRQDWAGELYENGSFYMTTRHHFMGAGHMQHGRRAYFEMDDEYSFDVDMDLDWVLAEQRVLRFGYFGRMQGLRSRIQMVVFARDGVLTDSQVYINEIGREFRFYNFSDGNGIRKLQDKGLELKIIGAHEAIDDVDQSQFGVKMNAADNRCKLVENWLKERSLTWDNIAYIGSDLPDLECMKRAGVSGATPESHPMVKIAAKFTSVRHAGEGAARDFCDHVLAIISSNNNNINKACVAN